MPKKFDVCMLIDDDPLDNFINKKLIKKNNFAEKVIVCNDAQKALKSLSSGKVQPDIIFLDIKMPLMNGFSFLDEYDKLDIDKNHTKIYILSMSLNPTEIEQAKRNKYVTSFLKKNLTPEMLLELAS